MESDYITFYVFEEKTNYELQNAEIREVVSPSMHPNGDIQYLDTIIPKDYYLNYMGPRFT